MTPDLIAGFIIGLTIGGCFGFLVASLASMGDGHVHDLDRKHGRQPRDD